MPTDNELSGAKDEALARLLTFLKGDPGNRALRADAAERALQTGSPGVAKALIEEGGREPGNRELNLLGLAQIRLGDYAAAAGTFRSLRARGVDEPPVKFNLAWSLAMQKDFAEALELLTPDVTDRLAQGAMLEVQLLHQLGKFKEAGTAARRHIAVFPHDPGLNASVSVLALDIEDIELARSSALKSPDRPESMTTLGTLALGESDIDAALELFDRAVERNPALPRAWIGRGLARLVSRDPGAASDLDHGAGLFGDHIGSWLAAGWAQLIAGDLETARSRFTRALEIDDNFGETHGSLAVIDALEGRTEDAWREIGVAKRLDRSCFSAPFAKVLLTAHAGKEGEARALLARILETPVNDGGDTILTAVGKIGLNPPASPR